MWVSECLSTVCPFLCLSRSLPFHLPLSNSLSRSLALTFSFIFFFPPSLVLWLSRSLACSLSFCFCARARHLPLSLSLILSLREQHYYFAGDIPPPPIFSLTLLLFFSGGSASIRGRYCVAKFSSMEEGSPANDARLVSLNQGKKKRAHITNVSAKETCDFKEPTHRSHPI